MRKRTIHHFADFLQREEGATSTEYALLQSLVVVAYVASVAVFGGYVRQTLMQIGTALSAMP